MVQAYQNPQQLPPPANFIFSGTVVTVPDVWGNQFPVSETLVELQTSDTNFISIRNVFHQGPLTIGAELTGEGFFRITSHRHPRIIPLNSLALRMTNTATGGVYDHKINWQFFQPEYLAIFNQVMYDLGKIQAPFPNDLQPVASVNGVQCKYPADFASRLASVAGPFRWTGTIELMRSDLGSPDPAPNIDDLFFALESVSNGTPANITPVLAGLLAKILKINLTKIQYSTDVFLAALKHYSNTRFNTLNITDFRSAELEKAAQQAFKVAGHLNFFGFKGRAAFCALLFIAGRVAYGQHISVSTMEVGPNWVTTIQVV